jgi:hypothetical protein
MMLQTDRITSRSTSKDMLEIRDQEPILQTFLFYRFCKLDCFVDINYLLGGIKQSSLQKRVNKFTHELDFCD